MLEELVNYLTQLATPTTSPIYLAVNTAGMLTLQGVTGGQKVEVYAYDMQSAETPFVRVYEPEGSETQGDAFLGGGYHETRQLVFECAAHGSTVLEARRRASALARAIEGKLYTTKGTIQSGTLTTSDLGGTTGYDKIDDFWLLPGQPPSTKGPGTDSDKPLWTATSLVRVAVRIIKFRPKN